MHIRISNYLRFERQIQKITSFKKPILLLKRLSFLNNQRFEQVSVKYKKY